MKLGFSSKGGAMSDTNETKLVTNKQGVHSSYNFDHLNIGGSYQPSSSQGPANNQSADHEYANDEFEGDHHNGEYHSIEQHSLAKDSNNRGGGNGEFRRKGGKRSATTKDSKIMNTMKAYLP